MSPCARAPCSATSDARSDVTDGRFTCFREPRPGRPIYKYTAHTTDALRREGGRKQYAPAEMGRFLPHDYGISVYRVPAHRCVLGNGRWLGR